MTKTDAIALFGSAKGLAEALGITEGAVSQWGDEMPELRRYQVEAIISNRERGGIAQ